MTHRSRTAILARSLRALFSIVLLLSALTLAVEAARRERTPDTWRPLHYDVALSFDDQLSEITSAKTQIKVLILKEPVTTLDLDFGEMTVDAVAVDGTPARYEQRDGLLNVTLAEAAKKDARLSVTVTYHGKPKDGLILMTDKDGRPSATGDNWPNRVHHWIPCLDHPSAKATVSFTITAPARDLVVANGKMGETRTNADTTRTWTYTEGEPIPPYCMVIAVGEFARLEPKTPALTLLSYYVPQSDRRFAIRGFAAAAPSIALFSEKVAPYPYEKLALIVGATRFGGMENSSAIVFPGTLFDNFEAAQPRSRRFNIKRGVMEVTAHEIAHQWFGDSVTEATWADLWLSEGFADYFAGLFVERYEGRIAFRDYMRRQAEKYLRYERERRAPIHDRETEDLLKLLNPNNYEKGSWVLHMLRGMMGDQRFFQAIQSYYRAHKGGVATTEDLRAACEAASGMNLKDFFTRWVYESGHPRYDVSWQWQPPTRFGRSQSGGHIDLSIRQLQDDAPFLMPLTVEIMTARGARRITIIPTGKETKQKIPSLHRPTTLRVDPDEVILKEINVRELRRNSGLRRAA
jgi:aminopeptidase N